MAGGAALGRGIENFGEAIGKALEKRKQQGDLAVAMRKMLQTAYPDRKDDFNSMGLADMQGIVQGEAMKSAMEKAARDKQQAQQALDLGKLELDRVKRGPAFFQALGGDLPQVLRPDIMERASRDPMARVGVAAGTSGYPLDPREGASLVEAMARMAPPGPVSIPVGLEVSSMTVGSGGRPSVTYSRPKSDTDREPSLEVGIGEADVFGNYPQKARVPWSFLQKHRKELEAEGVKLPSNAKQVTAPNEEFAPGTRVNQDGVEYEFDGKEWKAVK